MFFVCHVMAGGSVVLQLPDDKEVDDEQSFIAFCVTDFNGMMYVYAAGGASI